MISARANSNGIETTNKTVNHNQNNNVFAVNENDGAILGGPTY
jgi:hypothetical protein